MLTYVEKKKKIYERLERRLRSDDPVETFNGLKKLYHDHRLMLALLRSRRARV